jgi:translocation and assembly module TamB
VSEATEPNGIEPNGSDPAPEQGARRWPRGTKRRAAGRWSHRLLMLLAAVIAAVIVTFFNVDIGNISIAGRSLRTEAEKRATKFLEREMTIDRIYAYVTPGKFAFEGVKIKGPYPNAPSFFEAKRIVVNVPWWTLFSKQLHIDVTLTGWRMVVQRWPDGNAHLPRLTPKPNPDAKPPWFKIRGLAVYANDGEFVYDDGVTPWSVIGPNLNFSIVRADNLSTYVGVAEFRRGTVKVQQFEPMAADFRTWFQVDGGIVKLKHIDLLTDGARSHLNGYVNFRNWPEQEYHIQSVVDFSRMRELFWSKATWRMSGKGDFTGIFKLFKAGKDGKETGRDLSGEFTSADAELKIDNTTWRFPNLHGDLQWTQSQFVVSHADADFLGGRMRLTYGLSPLGVPEGATATFNAEYRDVDLNRFTRTIGWTALEPQGRMRGQVSMAWRNNRPFSETVEGSGFTIIPAASGVTLASATLPATPVDRALREGEGPFQEYRPFGEFPIAADTSYRFSGGSLDFDPSWVATPTTFVRFSGHARGGPVNVPFHVTSYDWQNSDRLFTAILSNFTRRATRAIEVGGQGTFDGVLTKAFNAPRIEGRFAADHMWAWKETWGHATGDIVVENSYLTVKDGKVDHPSGGTVLTSGRFSLGYPRADGGDEIDAQIRAEHMPIEPLRRAFGLIDWPFEGELALADLHLRGVYEKPSGEGTMRIANGTAWNETFEAVTGDLLFEGDGSVRLRNVEISKGPGRITGDAWLSWASQVFSIVADGVGLPVESLKTFQVPRAPLTGVLSFKAAGAGPFDAPVWNIRDIVVPDLYAGGEGIGVLRAEIAYENNVLTVRELAAASPITDRLQLGCHGAITMNAQTDANLFCDFTNTSFDPYFKFVGRDLPFIRAIASGSVNVAGPLRDLTHLTVSARLTATTLTFFDYPLHNKEPLELSFRQNVIGLDSVQFEGDNTELILSGKADLTSRTADLKATGKADLAVLQAFYPATLSAGGEAKIQATLTGNFDDFVLAGQANIVNGKLKHYDIPHSLTEINGPITMREGRISVDGLTAVMGDGRVAFDGEILLDGYRPDRFDLMATGRSLHLRVPEGLQSTVNADLELRGPVNGPTLSGTVDVLRASYGLRLQSQVGYFGLLSGAVDSTPVRLRPIEESTASPFPMNLDITIRAQDVPFIENKGASAVVRGSAAVDIRGTIDNPIVTGHVDSDHGEWIFAGNRYDLVDGHIDFMNPLKFDPYFDLTAQTRVHSQGQNYLVTVQFSGTSGQWNPQFRSEPWLSQFQIMSLLLGETPDSGMAELRARNDAQELQAQTLQSAMFTILASPISATVGGALQRLTTVTAQIVPLLYGNDSNLQQLSPSARIVFGRRISNRIYVTYSRTLSGSQSEIILVEFDQNDQVSWVFSKNENQTFALDFRLRYVFR